MRHFAGDEGVEVVVERRERDRRGGRERRGGNGKKPAGGERRRVRVRGDRRLDERRATLVPVAEPPDLPRRARRHADSLLFVVRMEPSTQEQEDRDTARLVARFQAGDSDAFGKLYSRYYHRVYAYLKVALRDRYEAEDLAQDAFTNLFVKLRSYEQTDKPFRHWLFVAVRNVAIDALRKRARIEVSDEVVADRLEEEAADVPDEFEEKVLPRLSWITDRDLQVLVERLPLPQRQVLILRYMLDLPAKEVAEHLGHTPANVRKLQHRALAFLFERLTALGRTPERPYQTEKWTRRINQAGVLRERRWALFK